MKSRLQALGLLDRSIRATSDDELVSATEALDDDHKEAVERLVGGTVTPEAIREAVVHGRMNGTMESIAMVLSDAALADCIDKLGDHADEPTSEQITEVLPGLVERHGLAITRVMLASTVVGEAKASAIIRALLKSDDLVKLPKEEPRRIVPRPSATTAASTRTAEALRAKRHEARRIKQEEAA